MDWTAIGGRIRKQREFLGFTREGFAERIEVTPKFCSDIELGLKGISVPTLCRISSVLRLSTDYILYGKDREQETSQAERMLHQCTPKELAYAEQLLKTFLIAMNDREA